MPEHDDGLSYAEKLRRKGVQTRPSGWSHATKDVVVEGRTAEGGTFKATRDTAGNVITEETTPDGRQRKHVTVQLS